MGNQLLLIEDVDNVGRSGDIVKVKPGYARNFLLPQKMAVVADKRTLRMQAKLQEERAKRAAIDKEAAEKASENIKDMVLTIEVKVDQEGHMYGSVTQMDIVGLFAKQGIELEKRNVALLHPIKELGVKKITLKLKEGVMVEFTLHVVKEGTVPAEAPAKQE